ncbi:MAG: peptidoglycan DD-metalloendopeptidase family protein [Chitinispirillaceae bacterium]|nr:peptidoglycan DD-metalloendopeptidase family protein [Chitinispirillaceae bacterium]
MDGKRGRGTKVSRVIIIGCVVAASTGVRGGETPLKSVSHYDLEIKRSTKRLDEVRAGLEKGRAKLKALQQEEGTYLTQLEQVEKNISISRSYLEMLSARIDTVEAIIQRLSDSLVIAGRQLESRQKIMRQRLRRAYMNGPSNSLLMVFAAGSPLDAVNRVRYLEELNRYDRNLVGKIETARRAIDAKKRVQQEERVHLSSLRAAKETERGELVAEERQRKKMLSDVRRKKEGWEAMVKELEASQKELTAMVRLLERKRKKARASVSRKIVATFEKSKGTLPWPLEGPVVGRFGKVVHPEYRTIIMNNGVDIEADAGDAVRCIAAGTVIHTGSMRGLGKMVIVDHVGGYLSIYAQLHTIDVKLDQKVVMDAVLGRVGDPRSPGDAKLHFEIRKSAEALNPVEWLEKR